MKTARWLPLVVVLLVSSVIALAQQGTAFFGDILVLYRQDAGAFPSATNYRGGIVYDTGSETPWFSNGTTWQPISSGGGGGGGDGFWFDAGAGTFAIYASPTSNQVRMGTQNYPAYTGYTPIAGVFGTPDGGLSRPAMVVYTDGGMGMVIYVDRKARLSGSPQVATPNSSWWGAGLSILTDRDPALPATDYAQIYLGARANSALAAGHSAITHSGVVTSGTWGIVGGLTLSSGGDVGIIAGDRYGVSWPMFYMSGGAQSMSIGETPTSATARLTINALPAQAALNLTGVNTGTTAFRMVGSENGLDLGTGTVDEFFSNGTRVRLGNTPNAGGLDAFTFRVVGNTDGSNMVTSATSGNGGIGFRQSDNQLYTMSTGKESRPILSGPDWVYDGRVWNVDVNWENTACPVIRNTLIQATGGDVTVSCSDQQPGGAAVSGGFPVRGYRTFNTNNVAGSRSGFASGTMPATGVGGSPALFLERRGGPVMSFWMQTGSTLTDTRWYAGMLTAIQAVGLPSSGAQGAYFRYSPADGDTRIRRCTQDGTTVNCVNTGITPTVNTEYLLTMDCRESSTACRAYIDGAPQGANTANLPGLTTNMGFVFAIENGNSTAQSWGLGRVSIRTE